MTPCSCDPTPARSHLDDRPGAQLVHVTDASGVWHGVLIGEAFHKVALLEPSPEYLAAHAEAAEDRQRRERREQLREKARAGNLTLPEIQQALAELL